MRATPQMTRTLLVTFFIIVALGSVSLFSGRAFFGTDSRTNQPQPTQTQTLRRSANPPTARFSPRRLIEKSSLPSFEWKAASLATTAVFFAPSITAAKSAALAAGGDVNSNGSINPGDTLTYSVTVSNGVGAMDATGLSFTDTLDNNLTLVGGSVMASPVAVNESYTATGNVTISVPLGSGVLANDYLGLNPTATISAFDATSTHGGTVSVSGDGSFSYTSATTFTGTDTFTYKITDPTGQVVTAKEIITIKPPLIKAVGDTYRTPYNTPVNANAAHGDTYLPGSTFKVVTPPSSGAVVMNADGSYSYRPAKNFAGTVTFTYKVTDPYGQTATAVETIIIAPPKLVATPHSYLATFDKAFTSSAAKGNTYPVGSVFSVSKAPSTGTVTMRPDGTYTYVPPKGFTGTTTCSPLPPDVLTKGTSFSASSSPRMCTAASTTSRQAIPSPGSRSNTTRSGFSSRSRSVPQVWNSTTPNWASAR